MLASQSSHLTQLHVQVTIKIFYVSVQEKCKYMSSSSDILS